MYYNSLHCNALLYCRMLLLCCRHRLRVVALTTFTVPVLLLIVPGRTERRRLHYMPTDGHHVIRYVTLTADVYLPRRRRRPGHTTGHQLREMARWTLLHTRRP